MVSGSDRAACQPYLRGFGRVSDDRDTKQVTDRLRREA